MSATAFVSPATAQTCGQPYVVQRGDTLSAIAIRAFDDASLWPRIYENGRNAELIGTNPNNIQVGLVLDMPGCRDDFSPSRPPTVETTAEPAVTQTAPTTAFVPPIRLVTASDYRPLTDEGLPGGGMATQIIMAAFEASDLQNEFQVHFVNDWNAQLDTLVKLRMFDYTFPWGAPPDCTDMEAVDPTLRIRCEYVGSDVVFVIAYGMYAPANLQNPPQSYAELRGSRICRPDGWSMVDLEKQGLYAGRDYTWVRPGSINQCFLLLERGEVEFVSLERFTAEAAIADLGLTPFVKPLPSVVHSREFFLWAHRDNAETSLQWMREFNIGLRRIRENGTWDRISTWHLENFKRVIEEKIAAR